MEAVNKISGDHFYRGKLILSEGRKLCPACKAWKDLSEYHKRPERPLGLKPKCKSCSKVERKKHPKLQKYTEYKSGAKRRGIDFNLSKEEFNSFWKQPCDYCGDAISTIGIDRIDADKGYSIDNVVSCCAVCNVMKLALPRSVFIEHCYKVVKNDKGQNK